MAADLLNEAHATGQLPLEEYQRRLDLLLQATTTADLRTLTEDLGPDVGGPKRRHTGLSIAIAVAVAVLVIGIATGVWLSGSQVALAPRVAKKSSTAPSPPAEASICRTLAAGGQTGAPPLSHIAPESDAGVQVPAGLPSSVRQDAETWQSLLNADNVITDIRQRSTDVVALVPTSCLRAYDPQFTWAGPGRSSTTSETVSARVFPSYEVVSARSASGRCWYLLDVYPGPAPRSIIPELPRNSFGVRVDFVAAATHDRSCAAAGAPGRGPWADGLPDPNDPLPTQLMQEINQLGATPS